MIFLESVNNLGKLYFCDINGCRFFEWWLPRRDELNLPLCL